MSPQNSCAVTDELKALGVTTLQDQWNSRNPNADLFGIVEGYNSICQSRRGGQDFYQSITLVDPTTTGTNEAITTLLFHKSSTALLEQLHYGDILIVRGARMNEFHGKRQAVVQGKEKKVSSWCAIDASNLQPRVVKDMPFELSDDHHRIAKILRDWHHSIVPTMPAIPKQRGSHQQLTTEQINENVTYFNYVGMVVSFRRSFDNKRVEMILTDYTPNVIPMKGEERVGSISPKLLIQCTLWDKDAHECPDLEYGDFLRLRNAKRKMGYYQEIVVRPGHSPESQSRKVFKVDNENDEAVVEIKRRKKEFERSQRHPAADHSQPEITMEDTWTAVELKAPHATLEHILNDNNMENVYTTRAAVLDVKPRNLRDWMKKWCPACEWIEDVDAVACSQCHQTINEYTLMFSFLVQDHENRRLQLHIYGEEPKVMFENLKDIRPDDEYIEALRENVDRILSTNSIRPEIAFDFGIKSYITVDNERRFRLCSTIFHFD
ncbi:hypothetical protein O0I10_005829 [Lichtheimia ornata]|uniref:Protection of telomeres protein 1 n=1 Tax=Lichtheimia ornata TaxID=688661 RepID=A0AAD7XZC7_9FUNG|nr:uncharacterized protein O0I10_005829 [Lichtheimia ornata]KAJ8658476.1 hypothetical protein O0I10_005829 [Lichtheimia ornata]